MTEGQGEGFLVGTVVATDQDVAGTNSEVYYIWKTPSSLFKLHSDSGQITTLGTLTAGQAGSPENVHNLVVSSS